LSKSFLVSILKPGNKDFIFQCVVHAVREQSKKSRELLN
jgi:hypothetical protein